MLKGESMESIAVEVLIEKVDDNPLEQYNEYKHDPEDVVSEEPTEDVELIVYLPAAEEVEDLKENKDVEDEC